MTNAELHGCAFPGWQCFHCGEIFETVGGARDHFGAKPDAVPGCMIKVQLGAERGLLMKLREVEEELAKAQHQLLEECSEAANVLQAQQARHSRQLCNAEEAGYSRGLKASTELSETNISLSAKCDRLMASDQMTVGHLILTDPEKGTAKIASDISRTGSGLTQFDICHPDGSLFRVYFKVEEINPEENVIEGPWHGKTNR